MRTSPNAPLPIMFKGSKSFTVTFLRLNYKFKSRKIILRSSIEFCFFVEDVLLNKLFLTFTETECIHFLLEHVPSVFALVLILTFFVVFAFDVTLCLFGSLFHALGHVLGTLRRNCFEVLVLGCDLGGSVLACWVWMSVGLNLESHLNFWIILGE